MSFLSGLYVSKLELFNTNKSLNRRTKKSRNHFIFGTISNAQRMCLIFYFMPNIFSALPFLLVIIKVFGIYLQNFVTKWKKTGTKKRTAGRTTTPVCFQLPHSTLARKTLLLLNFSGSVVTNTYNGILFYFCAGSNSAENQKTSAEILKRIN